ncbi:MAG: hypothetical protein COS82_11550 [Zetaproteobacteria bacterium CG06_land_8_20_14_3_00_59_53]|nr:MAG: hypothetical protein AUK36_00780 [Zetaproteobacteria bacterium CG2_30_59_37]PIO90128.1 MAG: hypothetical protein COX56_04755 [Zetaproteobacteria bacterium CG23_combo_of_CG06-09_8_20_14_all_59_86]PIQ64849.1 MAG: hypothetical protein COV97_07225 [Zetaproteobacteria bacterium CG11_big_fil_rev_8_21_14_0_20_59_439]PIU69528.1 MAG: hypothetical protein COS82_11550 [Zetaproteobacteria bacterium CG06_land_8_20_14_3_00_59_53]PIU96718.1 MAG: hypothetical protein COS62_06850 [Zetaproteobacteria bac
MRAGVIGGGLCGLSAAIRLAQRGIGVDLFEAAPTPGGRTRSFFEPRIGQWVDNGPHLLSGAYHDTMQLLSEAGAAGNITWQGSLSLPLWDAARGHFQLKPQASLPLALTLPWSCSRLPGHGWSDIPSLLRIAGLLKRHVDPRENVHNWLRIARVPQALIRDLLEPMCLGAMNEPLERANAASFKSVLHDAFAGHTSARLGWFNRPLRDALIEPLITMAHGLGVRIHTSERIRDIRPESNGFELRTAQQSIHVDACILALPLRAAQQLVRAPVTAVTRRISNIHLWFTGMSPLSHPFIGGIDTTGQWFFDISSQMPGLRSATAKADRLRHICVVISNDETGLQGDALIARVCSELDGIGATDGSCKLHHARIVSEHHATASVTAGGSGLQIPQGMIDACEAPQPGDIPATIESAVRRGKTAANQCYLQLAN